MALVSLIFKFFINKIALANKWMRKMIPSWVRLQNFNAKKPILLFLFTNFSCRSFSLFVENSFSIALTKIPPPLFIITLYFLQGDPFICDQFLWTHWQHWGYCVVCNHEKTAEVPSTNANAFCI